MVELQIRSGLSVPVQLGGGPNGTQDVYAAAPGGWDQTEVSALQTYAGVVARSAAGFRSVRVAILLASRARSMGMVRPFFRSPNWRTRSTGQAQLMALGCRSGPTAHEIVWACTDPPAQKNRPAHHTPRQPRPIASAGHDALQQIGAAVTGADCCRLPRPLTSVGGLVPAHRRAQTQTLSASVGRPGQPSRRHGGSPAGGQSTWQASPQTHPPSPAAPPQRLANEGWDRQFDSGGGPRKSAGQH